MRMNLTGLIKPIVTRMAHRCARVSQYLNGAVMINFAKFEVCGLHYILRRSDLRGSGGAQFQLGDESFSQSPFRFAATSYDELFLEIEEHIGIELDDELCDLLRRTMGPLEPCDIAVPACSLVPNEIIGGQRPAQPGYGTSPSL